MQLRIVTEPLGRVNPIHYELCRSMQSADLVQQWSYQQITRAIDSVTP